MRSAPTLFSSSATMPICSRSIGTELFLKPGVTLDFESKSSYSVKVNVDDASVGTSPDLTSDTFTSRSRTFRPKR